MLPPVTLSVTLRLDYETQPDSVLVLNVLPARTHQQQIVMESLRVQGGEVAQAFAEAATGNRFIRLAAHGRGLQLEIEMQVRLLQLGLTADECSREIQTDPLTSAEALRYLMPSRYCESDILGQLCRREFIGIRQPFGRAQAIEAWIRRHLEPMQAQTDESPETAAGALFRRRGTPRDFAHLMIAMCRASGLPARYVSTLPWGRQPTQAAPQPWVEVLVDDEWLCFEPTRSIPRTALLRIGTGRDGAEVPMLVAGGGTVSTRRAESTVESLGADERTLRERDRATVAICTAKLGSLVQATRWHQDARQAVRGEPRRLPGTREATRSRSAEVLLFPTSNSRQAPPVPEPRFEPI